VIAVGTRVRVTDDPRPYIVGRIGTVGTCPHDYAPIDEHDVVVDLDDLGGFVDRDWHLDERSLEVLA
jgi:hypothetical protein